MSLLSSADAAFSGVAAAMLASLAAGCCVDDWPCEDAASLNAECKETKDCSIDGELITECESPECPLLRVPVGSTLSIPLKNYWSHHGARNDLVITRNWAKQEPPGYPDFTRATLELDGVAPDNCARDAHTIECRNLSADVALLTFRHDDAATVSDLVYIDMRDAECEAEGTICPR